MVVNRVNVLIVLIGFGIGYYLASSREPQPRHDRPVARWIARAARNALWFMALAEPAPAQYEGRQLVHARVDEHGQPFLDHGRGW